jgi:hypothetical protein
MIEAILDKRSNCEWKDLYLAGSDMTHSTTMYRGLQYLPEPDRNRKYKSAQLEIDAAFLQMMILQYGDEKKVDRTSILLGWTFKNDDNVRSVVLLCENAETDVENYFISYFNKLYATAIPIAPPPPALRPQRGLLNYLRRAPEM